MSESILLKMALIFATTALVSVGGIATMIPEIHRQAVDLNGWMTNDVFVSTFAISFGSSRLGRPVRSPSFKAPNPRCSKRRTQFTTVPGESPSAFAASRQLIPSATSNTPCNR